jgi:hypothetical protein
MLPSQSNQDANCINLFGEGCLAGQNVRTGTETAITPATVLVIEKRETIRVPHTEHASRPGSCLTFLRGLDRLAF